jgi:hypothetical protein
MNRIIIGETERAGLPLSAPICDLSDTRKLADGLLRFEQKEHYFELQQMVTCEDGKRGWIPVCCQRLEEK